MSANACKDVLKTMRKIFPGYEVVHVLDYDRTWEYNGCMCTTTEGKSLLPNVQLKGARVSDTKDHIQVRCRDGINVIEYLPMMRHLSSLMTSAQITSCYTHLYHRFLLVILVL